MSNGLRCCLLAICCPPGSRQQMDAVAAEILHSLGMKRAAEGPTMVDVDDVAACLVADYEFVPKGVARAIIAAYGIKTHTHSGE